MTKTTPTSSRSPARRRRSTSRTSRSTTRSPACASAWSTASTSSTRPTSSMRKSRLNLIVAGSEEAIVHGRGRRQGGQRRGHDRGARCSPTARSEALRQLQRSMFETLGIKKREFTPTPVNEELLKEIAEKCSAANCARRSTSRTRPRSRATRDRRAEETRRRKLSRRRARPSAPRRATSSTELKERIFRDDILNNRRRPDGRRFSEIRPISIEVGWLPRTHGSALFTRGETQALVTVTLGTSQDVQYIDSLEIGEIKRRFMLNYNFPPFSVGETGRVGSPGRREIGHGALAHRALDAVMPDEERVALHRPHRLGHHRVERLVVDGHGLRRNPRADGRRRADQGARRRRRDGPGRWRTRSTRS